jgi:uncharacterized membrane protein required for colicin V production
MFILLFSNLNGNWQQLLDGGGVEGCSLSKWIRLIKNYFLDDFLGFCNFSGLRLIEIFFRVFIKFNFFKSSLKLKVHCLNYFLKLSFKTSINLFKPSQKFEKKILKSKSSLKI